MPLYRVIIDVELHIKATSRDVVANRIRKMVGGRQVRREKL